MQQLATITILLLLILGACNSESDPVLNSFDKKSLHFIESVDSIKLDKYGIIMPEYIAKHKDWYIIKKYTNENHVDIINPNTGDVVNVVNRGRAENELMQISSIQYNEGKLNVYDTNLMKLLIYDVDSLIQESLVCHECYQFNEQTSEKFIKPFIIYHYNGMFLAVGFWGDNTWYRLMSERGELFDGIEQIQFKALEEMELIERTTFHLSSFISTNRSGDKAVCVMSMAPAISVSNICGNNIREYKRVIFGEPQIHPVRQENMPILRYSGDNKRAFCSVVADDTYIYILYSGKTLDSKEPSYQCRDLLIYDWDLNPIKRLVLSNGINSLFIEGDMLYGTSSYPESRIYVYDLHGLS